jgi:hypothetical protein
LLGGLFLWIGYNAGRLRRYRWAIGSSTLAMLPVSPLWPLMFGLGLWSFIRLRDPQVQRAFEAHKEWLAAHPPAPGPIRRFLTNTTCWVILACAVGIILCVQPVLPWFTLHMTGWWETAEAYGYQSPLVLGVAALLLLLATASIVQAFQERVTWLLPVASMFAGLLVLLTAAYVIIEETTGEHPCVIENTSPPGWTGLTRLRVRMLNREYKIPGSWAPNAGDYVSVHADPAVYLFAFVGMVLLTLGSVQLRGTLLRRQEAPEHDSTTTSPRTRIRKT